MGLEFMAGATMFALINLFLFCIVAYFVYRLAIKLGTYLVAESENKVVNFKTEMAAIVSITILMVFFGSVAQPKLSLDPVQNRALIEYQENDEEVVIKTPPPRTEELQGFESLK